MKLFTSAVLPYALVLLLQQASQVSAQRFLSSCHTCHLEPKADYLSCYCLKQRDPPKYMSTTLRVDDCIGVSNGHLVPGTNMSISLCDNKLPTFRPADGVFCAWANTDTYKCVHSCFGLDQYLSNQAGNLACH